MKFTKLQALGNDFVLTEDPKVRHYLREIANRKFGIGCDQIILLEGEKVSFWNQDGSSARFCGNGCRAIFRYLNRNGTIQTESGQVEGKLVQDLVKITYPYCKILDLDHEEKYTVDVGNVHKIVFGENGNFQWANPDPKFNHMYLYWENGWNMLIYEAGAGETEACGSGAMAASLAIWHKYKHTEPLKIKMRGGVLEMKKNTEGDYDFKNMNKNDKLDNYTKIEEQSKETLSQTKFTQTGSAEIVFIGEIKLT